jgi:hypothetical protein
MVFANLDFMAACNQDFAGGDEPDSSSRKTHIESVTLLQANLREH